MTLFAEDRFRQFVEDRRFVDLDGLDRMSFDHLVRYTARPPVVEGAVLYASLTPGRETIEIREEIAHFRALGQDFEWKLHAFARPADIEARLVDEGFVAGDEETFMMLALSGAKSTTLRRTRADIVRIVDTAGIADVLDVQHQVWGEAFDWLRPVFERCLRDEPDTLSMYCAYLDGRPVGSGWTDFIPGSAFPDLHGGAVVERARGLGIYRALLDGRLDEAVARGVRHLCVDASSLSRPILERAAGFVPICATVPMRMRFT